MALKDFENKTLRRRMTEKRICRFFLTAHPKVLRNIHILTAVLAAFINGLLKSNTIRKVVLQFTALPFIMYVGVLSSEPMARKPLCISKE